MGLTYKGLNECVDAFTDAYTGEDGCSITGYFVRVFGDIVA